MIELNNISKTYKIAERNKGFFGAFKSLFFRKYKYKQALKNASFKINEGEIVGYIGPNGAGKSTTIKIMCGILTPDNNGGTCEINGFVPWKEREKYVKHIGAVFGQRSNLSWDVPIIDSFQLLKEIYKIPNEMYESNLERLTTQLDIKDLLNIPLRQLSLGQKMRCEIAAALLHSPKVLFLDEPTIGLDSVSKLAVRNFIKTINKETNVTVILTTHDMNDIEALIDRVILIGKGQVLYDGPFVDIKNKYSKIKNIEVQFEQPQENVCLEGYEIVKQNHTSAVFKSDKENFKLTTFISDIEKKYKVSDVNVAGIEIEEVIASLYKEFGIWPNNLKFTSKSILQNKRNTDLLHSAGQQHKSFLGLCKLWCLWHFWELQVLLVFQFRKCHHTFGLDKCFIQCSFSTIHTTTFCHKFWMATFLMDLLNQLKCIINGFMTCIHPTLQKCFSVRQFCFW